MIIKVKNKNGSPIKKLPNGFNSWLEYWEYKKVRDVDNCSIRFCVNHANTGEYVSNANAKSEKYIIPICNSHKKVLETNELEVDTSFAVGAP